MADTLDKVNASFEDCEEVEDDVDVEGAEPEQDMTEPMIDLDAVMGAKDSGENVAGNAGKVDDANANVVSIEQYRAG